MAHYLSDEELTRTAPAEVAAFASPVPTQIVSNGEFVPLPQTREQQRVEARIKEMADGLGPRHGMDRRRFLASRAGGYVTGALMTFLDKLGGRWNISLFHYRNHGADFGRVLAGFEVPPGDTREFDAFLDGLGYRYQREQENSAYNLFLAWQTAAAQRT